MWKWIVCCTAGVLLMAGGAFVMSASAELPEVIQIDSGRVSGTPSWGAGVTLFRGIPFAAPPVGDNRWRPPQPVDPWDDVLVADRFEPACMQTQRPLNRRSWNSGVAGYSEDCLYLNIWTPATSQDEKLPVMVWIYGGGGVEGSGAESIYDGNGLAKKGVVYVTFNYRVNVFGWMAHPELTRESRHDASGNYGALDQLAAIKWVRKNIRKFGGDPENITILGESGGARSVNWLMASPLSRGLFHRAIGQSHSVFGPMDTLETAHEYGKDIARAADVQSIDALRELPAEEVHQAFQEHPAGMNAAIVDGWFLPEDIHTQFARGKQVDVPLITGGNSDEFGRPRRSEGAPETVDEYRAWVADAYGEVSDKILAAYPANDDSEVEQAYYDLTVDNNFAGHRTWAKLHVENSTSPAFLYLFSHSVPGFSDSGKPTRRGAYHGAEILYVLNNLRAADAPWSEEDRVIADALSSYWVNFARNGNPNGEGLPEWPAYDPDNERVMNLGNPLRVREFNVQGIEAISEYVSNQRKQ